MFIEEKAYPIKSCILCLNRNKNWQIQFLVGKYIKKIKPRGQNREASKRKEAGNTPHRIKHALRRNYPSTSVNDVLVPRTKTGSPATILELTRAVNSLSVRAIIYMYSICIYYVHFCDIKIYSIFQLLHTVIIFFFFYIKFYIVYSH